MAETIDILSGWKLDETHRARIQSVSPRLTLRQVPENEIEDSLSDTEILLIRNLALKLDRAPRLKWIQMAGAGLDKLDHASIRERGITVTNASGIHAVPIGEYVLSFMLNLSYRIPEVLALQRGRDWPADARKRLVGRELRGNTAGVVGYGSIGREIGRLARSFGMRLLAAKRSPEEPEDTGYTLSGVGDPHGEAVDRMYGPEELNEMLAECDFVVLTVPLTDRTEGMIGEAALRAMKPSAFLINVARGRVVDEKALLAALRGRWIAGAALDVFGQEPLPQDSAFYELENVIISPHNAGNTPLYNDRLADLFVENLGRYLRRKPLLNVVDLEQKY